MKISIVGNKSKKSVKTVASLVEVMFPGAVILVKEKFTFPELKDSYVLEASYDLIGKSDRETAENICRKLNIGVSESVLESL